MKEIYKFSVSMEPTDAILTRNQLIFFGDFLAFFKNQDQSGSSYDF
jgi:hypothetical protein